MRGSHVHEPAMGDPREMPEIVADQPAPGEHTAAQVKILAVLEHIDPFEAEPRRKSRT